MLPLEDLSGEEKDMKQIHSLILYEPDSETVFDAIVRSIWLVWYMVPCASLLPVSWQREGQQWMPHPRMQER